MFYSKYKSEETFLKCLKEFKSLITPNYWTKDNNGIVIKNQQWINKEFEYELKVFAPFALNKPDVPIHNVLTFKKIKGEQYVEEYLNGELIDGKNRPYIIDYITNNLGQEFKALFFYLGSWINLEFADYKYLSRIKEDSECLLIDFNKPSYVELFNLTTMPKISEKASINKETGEMKTKKRIREIKEPIKVTRIKESKCFDNSRQYKVAERRLKHQNSPKEEDLRKRLKSCTIRVLKRKKLNSEEIHNNAMVCIKHTNGTIFRLTRSNAKVMMDNEPKMYSFCQKWEWKLQEGKKEFKFPEQKINETKKQAKAIRAAKKVRESEWKQNAKPIVKIKKQERKAKQKEYVRMYVTFRHYDDNGNLINTFSRRCAPATAKPNISAGQISRKLEAKFKEKHPNSKVVFSIGESKYNKLRAFIAKKEKIVTKEKLIIPIKLTESEKLKPQTVKSGESNVIALDSITKFKVKCERILPSPFKKTSKKWLCPMKKKKGVKNGK